MVGGLKMVEVKETELPGVGMKYTFESTEAGDRLVLVLHADGKREIYLFEKDAESPTSVITLSDEEARKAGAILGGAFFKPEATEALDVVLSKLAVEWYKLSPESPAVGKSIGKMKIRKKTGVSIIAILRGSKCIPNPTPDNMLEEGDMLIVIGTRKHIPDFEELVIGKAK
jgi:TrkA domain protein